MSQTLPKERVSPTLALTDKAPVRDFVDIRKISKEEKYSLRISEESVYADNEWKFNIEYPDIEPSQRVIKFIKIKFNDGSDITNTRNIIMLEQVKDYVYTLLVDPPSTYPKIYVINDSLKNGVRWLCEYMLDESIKR